MTKKEIGKALIKARGKKTYYQVCKDAVLTYQQLHHMESGTSNYTLDKLLKLCDVLGLEFEISRSL